jgi:hypothetical protein
MPTRIESIQRVEARESSVWQHVNEAHEIIRNDHDPGVIPTIQLKEGWKNGNIHIGTAAPAVDVGHTWDIYLVVPAGTGWLAASAIYVRRP